VAIGDGHNDVALFRRVGFSIAPANAHPDVIAAADAATASNDDDGVAAALDALCDLPPRPVD
jgi:hydroxymethylpyrimidine pyrophosphatase-like HAD family hydrolase